MVYLIMAIDQDLIDDTIKKLTIKQNKTKDTGREIQKLLNNLYLIRGDKPKDPVTEEEMSPTRIKEIFNSTVKKGMKYLGDNK